MERTCASKHWPERIGWAVLIAGACAGNLLGGEGGEVVRRGLHLFQQALALAAGAAIGLCLLLLVRLVFPGLTAAGVRSLQQSLWRSLGMGVFMVVVLTCAVFVVHLVSQPLAGLLAVVLLAILGLLGAAAVSEYLGGRVLADASSAWSGAGQTAVGWLVWAGASLAPVLGWFVILPFLALAGVGAVIRPLCQRRPAAPAVEDAPAAGERADAP